MVFSRSSVTMAAAILSATACAEAGSGGDTAPGPEPATLHLISAIQGTPVTQGGNRFGEVDVSPLIDRLVQIEAVVVGDNLVIASLNVLNFFTTLDEGSNTTALGLDPRGADSAAELERQLAKTVAAIVSMDADLLGLVEQVLSLAGENAGC